MIIQKLIFFYIFIIIFFLSLFLGSCNKRISNHGTVLSKQEITMIQNTKLNKSEIIEILGQPSIKSTFSNNVWYYISHMQQERAYFEVKTISNNILKITFNEEQLVSNYQFFSKGRILDIEINQNKTEKDVDKDEGILLDFLSSFKRRLKDPVGNN